MAEEDSHSEDFIPDNNDLTRDEPASYQLLREELVAYLNTLNDREARVLELRFGLEDGKTRTLEEVARDFGVTRERIRQIEAKALRKLRPDNQKPPHLQTGGLPIDLDDDERELLLWHRREVFRSSFGAGNFTPTDDD